MIGFKRNTLWQAKFNLFENLSLQLKTTTKKQPSWDKKRSMYWLSTLNYCNRRRIIIPSWQMIRFKLINSFEILKNETNHSNKTNMKKSLRNLKTRLKKLTLILKHQDDSLMTSYKSRCKSLMKKRDFFLREKDFWLITTPKYQNKFRT